MTGEGDEPSTTNRLQYPMVDLFTGGMIMPLMFINAAMTWYLLSLNTPLAFAEAWTKALGIPVPPLALGHSGGRQRE
jgi:hypothetical protein